MISVIFKTGNVQSHNFVVDMKIDRTSGWLTLTIAEGVFPYTRSLGEDNSFAIDYGHTDYKLECIECVYVDGVKVYGPES